MYLLPKSAQRKVVIEMDKIIDFANDKNIWIIEDNCDALGSKLNGQLTGTFGDISTLSFYPAHHITMGEGGAVFTNNFRIPSNGTGSSYTVSGFYVDYIPGGRI